MRYQNIELLVQEDVAIVTLNRPARLNAYTPDMGDELVHALREAADDAAVSAVIITGKGKAFCAGADKDFLAGERGHNGLQLGEEEFIASFAAELAALPIVTIAAINGAAVGIGITAMLAFDLRVAAADAPFVLNFAELGIMPGLGSTYFLPRLVGAARARQLLLCERRFNGDQAAHYGLVNKAVPAAEVLPTALDWARSAGDCKTPMIDLIKRGLAAGNDSTLAQAVVSEKALSAEVNR